MSWDSNSALKKGAVVVVVAVLLLIPLAMLRTLVTERAGLRDLAIQSVARGWGGRQLLGGPVLSIPLTRTLDNGQIETRNWYVLADSVDLDVQVVVQAERRKLGVYEVPVYVAELHASGQFDVAPEIAKLTSGGNAVRINMERATLLLPISDPRGVRDIKVAGAPLTAGSLEAWHGFPIAALAAPLRSDIDLASRKVPFDLTLRVAGTQSLAFVPLSRAVHVKARGNWPAPGFANGFLPVERLIKDGRFEASWQVLDLNRLYGASWLEGEVPTSELEDSAFGVDLTQPVDLYQQAERAVKYAGLFVGLSFLTLFIWEHLVHRPVHPIQYGLMGLSLCVFFLLLLALAEQIGFGPAYALAAFALCLLLAVYLSGAMGTRGSGVASGASFAAIYALLYLLITSDDYALLVGSLTLFGVLAAAMLLTREIDWYHSTE